MRVHFLVPDGIDDPRRPSGGNNYDRRVAEELRALGWDVVEVRATGSLADVLLAIPSGELVLVDGLIACAGSAVVIPETARLDVVVLVHMPVDECPVLPAARAIVTTSAWARDRLISHYVLPRDRISVAEPGVDPADVAPGTADGRSILCVGAIAAHKGQDVLLDALAELTDVSWRCRCVGALDRDPGYVEALRGRAVAARVELPGPRTGAALDRTYATSDLLVLPSLTEAYGMVVTEALARGLPVVASAVGGIPEALGRASDGRPPGILVPPGDPAALASALRAWLTDGALRRDLRAAALERRSTLAGWAVTARQIAEVLGG